MVFLRRIAAARVMHLLTITHPHLSMLPKDIWQSMKSSGVDCRFKAVVGMFHKSEWSNQFVIATESEVFTSMSKSRATAMSSVSHLSVCQAGIACTRTPKQDASLEQFSTSSYVPTFLKLLESQLWRKVRFSKQSVPHELELRQQLCAKQTGHVLDVHLACMMQRDSPEGQI